MPGPAAELMFAPLELGFGVDATLSVEFLANREARTPGGQAQSRRRPDRPRGGSRRSRPLGRGRRAPASRPRAGGACSAAATARRSCARRCCSRVAGRDEEELEERVERLRESATGGCSCTAPAASSTASSSPRCRRRRFPLPEYKEHLLPDQLGAMVPHAISHAGSRIGPYIGYTLTGSRSPVQFDLAEACQQNRPPTCLLGRQPRLGQDDLPRAGGLAGLPAGLGADRRHRPQGRSPPRARCPGVAGPDRDDRALRRGALPRPARPDAGRRRGDPRGPHLQLPRLDPAGAGQARVADRSCASRSPRPPRPARAAAPRCSRASPPRASAEAAEAARAIEVHGSSGLAKLGLGTARDRAGRGRRRPGGLAADPQPHPAAGRHRALGAARGGAHEPRRPAPARRLRAAALRLRHRPATRCWRWTRPGRSPPTPRAGRCSSGSAASAAARTSPRSSPPRCSATPPSWSRWSGPSSPSGWRPRPRRAGRWSCCASTPTMRRRSSACSATGRGAATCATSTARWRRSRSTRRAWLLGELDTTPAAGGGDAAARRLGRGCRGERCDRRVRRRSRGAGIALAAGARALLGGACAGAPAAGGGRRRRRRRAHRAKPAAGQHKAPAKAEAEAEAPQLTSPAQVERRQPPRETSASGGQVDPLVGPRHPQSGLRPARPDPRPPDPPQPAKPAARRRATTRPPTTASTSSSRPASPTRSATFTTAFATSSTASGSG